MTFGRVLILAGLSAVPCCRVQAAVRAATEPSAVYAIIGADPELAAQTEAILRAAGEEMGAASGVWFGDTIRVVYVRAAESFDSVVGGRFPDWGAAAALGDRALIALRRPRDYSHAQSLPELLRHELAHLHLDAMTGLRNVPRWLHEGYAQQFAHEWRFGDDLIVARAAFTDNILPLRDIDGVNSFRSANARLAYAESYLAVGHFLNSYGWTGLIDLTGEIRSGRNWDDAFFTAIGVDYDGYEDEYLAFILAKYNWATFLGDTVFLWLGIVAVFLFLYLIKRQRSARRRREWEEEEAIADMLYAPFRPHDEGPSGNT